MLLTHASKSAARTIWRPLGDWIFASLEDLHGVTGDLFASHTFEVSLSQPNEQASAAPALEISRVGVGCKRLFVIGMNGFAGQPHPSVGSAPVGQRQRHGANDHLRCEL